jgi:hypothetical protein
MVAAAEMTPLDTAFAKLREDMDNNKAQSEYYDVFLNATFCVPTLNEEELSEGCEKPDDGQVLPMIIESEGNDYLMLFDTEERLHAWAGEPLPWVGVPAYVLAATTMPPLHWALNVGTEYSKQFLPDEIAWLREVVERCNAAAEETP